MTHPQTVATQATTAPPDRLPPAGMDRRFYAFFLDRLWAWLLYAGAAAASYHWLIEPGRTWLGAGAIAGTVLLVGLLTSLTVGTAGITPGHALLGLRIASAEHGGPIGVGRALLRLLVLGVATLPTLGFGTAALAWTAVVDPSGRRRGWHDLRARSEVVDVRPVPVEEEPEEPPSPLVNLTAMRLVPASPHPPREAPVRRSRARQAAAQAAEEAAAAPLRPGLGWPLVGPAPEETAAPATLGPRPTAPPVLPVVPAVRPPVARWQVTFDSGETFEVAGLTLVGRRPEPRPGEPAKRLVTLGSEDMSLSKTHAQFQVVPDGALVVMDRGSTNGSILLRGGVAQRLEGGRPATLRDGDRVRFGDREMTVARLA